MVGANIKRLMVVDIGTEAVKAKRVREEHLHYFDDWDEFPSPFNFRTIEAIFQQLPWWSGDKIVLSLPANFLKARIIFQIFERVLSQKAIDAKEAVEIHQTVLQGAGKEALNIFSGITGILPGDLEIVNSIILKGGVKIDGYSVPSLEGYEGTNLEFKILIILAPANYLKDIQASVKRAALGKGLNISSNIKIWHEAEYLSPLFAQGPDGIFIDIGGENTQIFLTKGGELRAVEEFGQGGKIFSQALSERLGLKGKDARLMKERYSTRELSEDSARRIEEFLWQPSRIWFAKLKAKLREMKRDRLFPPNIFLLGGGSSLPQIKTILKKGDWEDIFFAGNLTVKNFKNPQLAPLRLMMNYAKKNY